MWALHLADSALEAAPRDRRCPHCGLVSGKHGPAQGHPGPWSEDGAWRRGLGSAASVWRGHRGLLGGPRAGGDPAVPRTPAQVVGTEPSPRASYRPSPCQSVPRPSPGLVAPARGRPQPVGSQPSPPAIHPPPALGSSLPTPRVKPPAPSSPPRVQRWQGQPGAREKPGFLKSGPLGERSGPPPRSPSRRCLKLSAGRRGQPPPSCFIP